MKAPPLWHLSVVTSPEAEDTVTEVLTGLTGVPASSYHHLESGQTTVSAYLEDRDAWTRARASALKECLQHLEACGLGVAPAKIAFRRVRAVDWRESWKRHFGPVRVGRTLLVKPGWSRERAVPGQRVVILDPGLSFGTGQHPTTAFCLAQLVRARRSVPQEPRRTKPRNLLLHVQQKVARPAARKSLLDLGTGSGLLAIAAARLGYAPVDAFDFDPDSIRVAAENARRNRVADRLTLRRADLTKLPGRPRRRYDVVCANLTADLLLAERAKLAAFVKPGGLLVLAGILREQFAEVRAAYEAAGLRLVAEQARKEWHSGAFRREIPSTKLTSSKEAPETRLHA